MTKHKSKNGKGEWLIRKEYAIDEMFEINNKKYIPIKKVPGTVGCFEGCAFFAGTCRQCKHPNILCSSFWRDDKKSVIFMEVK